MWPNLSGNLAKPRVFVPREKIAAAKKARWFVAEFVDADPGLIAEELARLALEFDPGLLWDILPTDSVISVLLFRSNFRTEWLATEPIAGHRPWLYRLCRLQQGRGAHDVKHDLLSLLSARAQLGPVRLANMQLKVEAWPWHSGA